MKHSLEDLRSRVENITLAVLATDARYAHSHHDSSAEALTISQKADELGPVIVANQMQARRRNCIAGIHRSFSC